MEGFAWGGSEELWVKVAGYSLEQGHQVSISVKNWQPLHTKITGLVNKGAQLHTRKIELSKTIIQRIIKKVSASKKNKQWLWLLKEQPEAVVINMGGPFDVLYHPELLHILWDSKISYYIIQQFNFEHLVLNEHNRTLAKQAFTQAKKVYFVAERNKQVAERTLATSFTNAELVSNPANLQKLEYLEYPQLPNSQYQLAVVARLDVAYKGHDILLNVLASEKWKSRNWALNLYGKGPDTEYIKALVQHYQLTDKVFLHGSVQDIASIWKHNHLLVLPSIAEGTPLSLIEAMVCGRTAIVTNVGGNTNLVENNLNGFVVTYPSINALDESLETAWAKKNEWESLGKAARYAVLNKINFNSHIQIYDSIINRN